MVAYLLSGQVPDSSLLIVLLFSSWSTGAQEMNFQLLTLGWGGYPSTYCLKSTPCKRTLQGEAEVVKNLKQENEKGSVYTE